MLVTRKISEVTIGGDASDNPDPFGDFLFDFSAQQSLLSYRNINVIVHHNNLNVNLKITGKVQLDSNGNPMMSANDLVYLPCPQYCDPTD